MKHYLLDTNVLLDLFLNRSPWAADAAVIWDAHRQGLIRVSVAAFSVPTIFYIVRKQSSLTAARTAVNACLTTLDIESTNRATLIVAQTFTGVDFEDELQIATAMQASVDAIITRDPKEFAASPIPAVTPVDVVATLPAPPTP